MALFGLRCTRGAAIGGFLLGVVLAPNLMAQRSRLKGPIRSRDRVALAGHLRPQVSPDNDEGPADDVLLLKDLTLVLRPSAAQQAQLDQLLREQQDPTSGNYHRWLSPEQYAQRFGASPEDVARITDWLKRQNLDVTEVARARATVPAPAGLAASRPSPGRRRHQVPDDRRPGRRTTSTWYAADEARASAASASVMRRSMETRSCSRLTRPRGAADSPMVTRRRRSVPMLSVCHAARRGVAWLAARDGRR